MVYTSKNTKSAEYKYRHRTNQARNTNTKLRNSRSTKGQQVRSGRVNKPANRDNQQKPVVTTDLAK